MIREHKYVPIEISEFYPKSIQIESYLKSYEVDGWIGSRRDMQNFHRMYSEDEVKYCKVLFTRFVNVEDINDSPLIATNSSYKPWEHDSTSIDTLHGYEAEE